MIQRLNLLMFGNGKIHARGSIVSSFLLYSKKHSFFIFVFGFKKVVNERWCKDTLFAEWNEDSSGQKKGEVEDQAV